MALTRLGLYGGPRAALPSDVEITAGVDALTLTTYPASLGSDKNVSASTDALSLTTFAASIANDVNVAASVDALTLTTFGATVTVGVNIAATTDALTLTENAASITFDVNVLAATDVLVLTTYGAVIDDGSAVEVTVTGGGRTKRRKRYVVEVDGQIIEVENIAQAEAVLAQTRELAEQSAQQDVTSEVIPKPPRVSVKTVSGNITTSKVIQREVKRTQQVINRAYIEVAKRHERDMEISGLIHRKLKDEDDEDSILALLL